MEGMKSVFRSERRSLTLFHDGLAKRFPAATVHGYTTKHRSSGNKPPYMVE